MPNHNAQNFKRKARDSDNDLIQEVTAYIDENKGSFKAAANSATAKTTLEYVFSSFFISVSHAYLHDDMYTAEKIQKL